MRNPNRRNNPIAYAKMHHMPLIPRLQQLYTSKKTAEHMLWHSNHIMQDGVLTILQMLQHGNTLIEFTLYLLQSHGMYGLVHALIDSHHAQI